jgi:hypothetical protein
VEATCEAIFGLMMSMDATRYEYAAGPFIWCLPNADI